MGADGGDVVGDVGAGGRVADYEDLFIGVRVCGFVEFGVGDGAWVGGVPFFDAGDIGDVGDFVVASGYDDGIVILRGGVVGS